MEKKCDLITNLTISTNFKLYQTKKEATGTRKKQHDYITDYTRRSGEMIGETQRYDGQ